MPQLDLATYVTQCFYTIIVFSGCLLLVNYKIIRSTYKQYRFRVLYIREIKDMIGVLKSENVKSQSELESSHIYFVNWIANYLIKRFSDDSAVIRKLHRNYIEKTQKIATERFEEVKINHEIFHK